MLNALNEVLRDDYIRDSVAGVEPLEQGHREGRDPVQADGAAQGLPPQHRRAVGRQGVAGWPRGQRCRVERQCRQVAAFSQDRAYVASLMGRVVEPGKFANWIAPPVMGINRQPVDFEYVRFN